MQNLAKLSSISATWPNLEKRKAALAQLNALRKKGTKANAAITAIPFFVNDHNTCQSANDFVTAAGQKLYPQWQVLIKLRAELETALDSLRVQYHNADANGKQTLTQRITTAEENFETQIRKAENSTSK